MKQIEKFIEKLKGWKNNFEIKDYEFEKYDCEIANLQKCAKKGTYTKECLSAWQNIYNAKYFELHHPIKNHILTRAVCNFYIPTGFHLNFIFFIDKNNKNFWIAFQIHGIADCFFTEDSLYFNLLPQQWSRNLFWWQVEQLLPLLSNAPFNRLCFRDIPFSLVFNNARPYHFMGDDLAWFLKLQMQKNNKNLLNIRAFFIPKNKAQTRIIDENCVYIAPRIHFNSNLSEVKRIIYDESLQDFASLVEQPDLRNPKEIAHLNINQAVFTYSGGGGLLYV